MNYFAVIVAAIAGLAIGSVWYSPALFGKAWGKLMRESGEAETGVASSYLFEFIVTLIMAYVLGELVAALTAYTLLAAIVLAFWLWLGFQAPIYFSNIWFERRSWQWFWIAALHRLVEMIVMAIILALWV